MTKNEFITKYQMKELTEKDGFIIEIVYATNNNFTKKQVYTNPICMLREETAKKLIKANSILKEYGFKIKIWDTFRPIKYQEHFWEICPDEKFVANPYKNECNHCKGSSVDITLCTLDGKKVDMPTEFDHFGIESYRNYYPNLSKDIQYNVILLEDIMIKCGFLPNIYEWWHFNDSDNYDIIREFYEDKV